MEADFLRLLADARSSGGVRGWLGVWARILAEALRPLPGRPGSAPPRDRHRSTRVHGRGIGPLSAAWSDVATAARALRRSPGFTASVVGVLGVAVAFNVAVFAVIQAYLLRPLPYPEPDRVVEVRPATPAVGWRDGGDVFEKAVSWSLDGFTLVGADAPDVVLGAWVSPDFFDVFGVHAHLGRTFTVQDSDARVAVISHGVWMRHFGGDPKVVGRSLQAYSAEARTGHRLAFTVVGVLPPDFWYFNRYTDVLVPLASDGPVHVGRLRPDVPPEQAEAILTARARAAGEGASGDGFRVRVRALQEVYTAAIRRRLAVMQATALLVLLVACANAGVLLLLRGEGRRRELGMRRALGAGRRRLAVLLVSEGLLLAVLAALLGLALGTGALWGLGDTVVARLGRALPGGPATLRVDGWSVLVTTSACAVVGVVFGSFPAWFAVRRDSVDLIGLTRRPTTASAPTGRARAVLVGTELALSLTLLTGGALMVRSALHLERTRLGFSPKGLSAYTVGLTSEGAADPARRTTFFEELARTVSGARGVVSAGLALAAPFDGPLVTREVEIEAPGHGALPEAVPEVASPGYFATLGITPLRGRALSEEDGPGGEPVAVVSESLADRLWPGGDAVGRRIRFRAWRMPEMAEAPGRWLRVVGVVPDVVDGVEGARPTVYVPFRQAPVAWMTLVVRVRPGIDGVADEVRGALRRLDPDVPIYSHQELVAAVARARAPSRFFAALLGCFSGFALLLAVLGVYGVSAYAARLRRKDVAVRMALGAGRASVEGFFVRRYAGVLCLGVLGGAAGGRLLGRALNGQLYGVAGDDLVTSGAMALLLALIALSAAWIPARQAARADPAEILREE